MANLDNPTGLTLVGNVHGGASKPKLTPVYLSDSYGTDIFIGDPVTRVAGGSNSAHIDVTGIGRFRPGTLPQVEKSTLGDGNVITGVIVSIVATGEDDDITYGKASTNRVALICTDPHAVYSVQADGVVPVTSVGLNANLIETHSGSTYTGQSGIELDTTVDPPDADASNQLRILSAVNDVKNDATITHADFLVQINTATEVNSSLGI